MGPAERETAVAHLIGRLNKLGSLMPDRIVGFMTDRIEVGNGVEADDSFLASDGTMSVLGLLNSLLDLQERRIAMEVGDHSRFIAFTYTTVRD